MYFLMPAEDGVGALAVFYIVLSILMLIAAIAFVVFIIRWMIDLRDIMSGIRCWIKAINSKMPNNKTLDNKTPDKTNQIGENAKN